jgi:hypothetical protein
MAVTLGVHRLALTSPDARLTAFDTLRFLETKSATDAAGPPIKAL